MLTAIETTGTIKQDGRIVIDETFSVNAPVSVRVIVLFPESEDVSEKEWMQAAAKEDIYSLADGKPLDR